MSKILFIVGPTASGKTRRAVECARAFGGEIISADSRQVYRGMDIGSGKDIEEYGSVPYHLIDIADAGTVYNLHQYLQAFSKAKAGIESRGALPVVCGGSGLYAESALGGLSLPDVPSNPELRASLAGKSIAELADILASYRILHNVTDLDSPARAIRAIEIASYIADHPEAASTTKPAPLKGAVTVGIDLPREERRHRISLRLRQRLDNGMIDEVRSLIDNGVDPEVMIRYGLEYRFITLYLLGKLSLQEMTSSLEIAIHQFAKRQMTWFRGMERRGYPIVWLPYDLNTDEFTGRVKTLLDNVEE